MLTQLIKSTPYFKNPEITSFQRDGTVTDGASISLLKENFLYILFEDDNRLEIWDVATYNTSILISTTIDAGDLNKPTAITISWDGNTLFIGSQVAGNIFAWDVTDKTLPVHLATSASVATLTDIRYTQIDNVEYVFGCRMGGILFNFTWDPSVPEFTNLSTLSVGQTPLSVHIHDNYLISSLSTGNTLVLVDISDPSVMVEFDRLVDNDMQGGREAKFFIKDDGSIHILWISRNPSGGGNIRAYVAEIDTATNLFINAVFFENDVFELTWDFSFINNKYAIGGARTGDNLFCVDLRDVANPVVLGSFQAKLFSYVISNVDASSNLAAFQTVNDGALKFPLRGVDISVTGIDYTPGGASGTLAEVAATTQTAIQLAVTAAGLSDSDKVIVENFDVVNNNFVIYDLIEDGTSNIGVLVPEGTGTDVTTGAFLALDSSNATALTANQGVDTVTSVIVDDRRIIVTNRRPFYFMEINLANFDLPTVNSSTVVCDNVVSTNVKLKELDEEIEAKTIRDNGNLFWSKRTNALMFSGDNKSNYASAPNQSQVHVGVRSDFDAFRIGNEITIPPGTLVVCRTLVNITPYHIIMSSNSGIVGSARGITGIIGDPSPAGPLVETDGSDTGLNPATYRNITLQNFTSTEAAFKHDNGNTGGALFENVEILLSKFEIGEFGGLLTDTVTFIEAPIIFSGSDIMNTVSHWTQRACGIISQVFGNTGLTFTATSAVNIVDFDQGLFPTDGTSTAIDVIAGAAIGSFNIIGTFIDGNTTEPFTKGFTQKDDTVMVRGMTGAGALPNSATQIVVSAVNNAGTEVTITTQNVWTNIEGAGLTYSADASLEKLVLTDTGTGLVTRIGSPQENFKVTGSVTIARVGGTNTNFDIGVSIDGADPEPSSVAHNLASNTNGQTSIVTTPVALGVGQTAQLQILNEDSTANFDVFASILKVFV